ncbi:hypothetical protein ACFL4G_04985 [Thermodesulfobacteriota bacterium]
MTQKEKILLLNPLRYLVAVFIAIGGCMHAIGLFMAICDNQIFPWWFWLIYLFAIPGYLICSVLIIKNWKAGYFITALAPFIGGTLIFFGFLFPHSRFLILIPGTYTTEISLVGFFTLLTEPVAAIMAVFLIVHAVWDQGSVKAQHLGPNK